MAKFVIECPVCHRYAEARTGFFARKKIDCACGHVIDVRTEKLTSRVCPNCGNHVVYDQSKGADAKCPVCHEPINTREIQEKTVEFSCRQCGVRLHTSKGASTHTCPVCDHVNDVAERLKAEEIKRDGLASIIKYEGDSDTLVWKHPIEDFNLGSQLIVHESQEAILFRDGQALDVFGPGRYTLETQQMPILEKLYKLPTDNQGTFHSEVYFVNQAHLMGIKWGTDSKIGLFDPRSGLHVDLGASGDFNIRVSNSRKFLLKVVGTTGGFKQGQLVGGTPGEKGYFRSLIMTRVKSYLAGTIREKNISVLEIDERLMELSEELKAKINLYLEDYGLELTEFMVVRVVTPDDDPDFVRMKKQFAQRYLGVQDEQIKRDIAFAAGDRKRVEAQTEAEMKIIGARGDAEAERIRMQAQADAYRMQAAAEAEEMRMKGYTYREETARQVGTEAMKNGIAGNGGGAVGILGDVAGMGIAMGAMGSVMNMTKDALNPMMDAASQMGQAVGAAVDDGWECPNCGEKNITSKCCPECGSKKPEPMQGWECPNCGEKNITSKFCPECGSKKPEPPQGWDCPNCGEKNITSKFCPECGSKKPEAPATWNCPECGNQGISAKFCPECGCKKP